MADNDRRVVIPRLNVRNTVLRNVRAGSLTELARFAALAPLPNLWGFDPGDRQSISDTILLMFYYFKEDIGLNKLHDGVKDWYEVGNNSLEHNIAVMTHVLREWATYHIEKGEFDEWAEVARTIRYQGQDVEIQLRADSADFRIKGS